MCLDFLLNLSPFCTLVSLGQRKVVVIEGYVIIKVQVSKQKAKYIPQE